MKPERIVRMALIGLLLNSPAPVRAEELPAELIACRAEADDGERLSCYDRVIDAKAAPSTAAAQEKFGYGEIRERKEREESEKDPQRLSELVATVTAIARRPNGTHVITLDNGQVWAERSIEPFFRIKVGETVRIKPAALGSFLLSTPANRSTRVTRLE